MEIAKKALLIGFFVFLAFAFLNPNPFGNNPDIVGDESYFLSTALFSIQKMTLPGWEFTPSGAYYGGPQTYVDTLALTPVLGAVLAAHDFSVPAAKLWVAQNTGELLHVLRLVNGAAALATLLFLFLYFKKRSIPRPLALTLALFALLLLGNVLVVEFVHTAKMWVFYILFVAVMSVLFLAQEYYLSRLGKPFIAKERYVAWWVWIAMLTFFQSWIGVLSVLLLMLYALLLRHMSVRDVWNYCLKYWYLIVLFPLTQIGFAYRFYSILNIFSETTTRTAEGAVDWFARLTKPLVFALETQPLIVLYAAGVLLLAVLAWRGRRALVESRSRTRIAVAVLHPVLVYLVFHVAIGFDAGPRYAIFLTMAFSLSAAMLLSEIGGRAVVGALVLAAALFAAVNVHAIELFWRSSSEVALLNTIMEKYNASTNVFITDYSAKRMTLPLNYESLPLLNNVRQEMGRFAFLLENRGLLPRESAFKPLAVIAYDTEEENAYRARFEDGAHSVWMIRRHCDERCSPQEAAGTCFELHLEACVISPQDTNALTEFMSSEQLGNSYIVRKVR